MAYEELDKQLADIEGSLQALEATATQRQAASDALTVEVTQLTGEIDLLSKTTQALMFISSKVLSQSTEVIDRLVTAGLRVVFDDLNFEFKTQITRARGKTGLVFELWQDGHTVPLTDSYGGGVVCVVGVLLRVVTVIILKLRRILILDEALADLHGQRYLSNASHLLKKISSELGFTILMVTDAQGLADESDKHYVASSGPNGLVLKLEFKI